jgi:CO/xanthine dehydrogenase Mo-binding subunit
VANTHPIGKSFPRKEGRKKVTGQALYVDDLSFPEMIHGITVRSPVARGRSKTSRSKATFRGTSSRSSPPKTFPAQITSH